MFVLSKLKLSAPPLFVKKIFFIIHKKIKKKSGPALTGEEMRHVFANKISVPVKKINYETIQ